MLKSVIIAKAIGKTLAPCPKPDDNPLGKPWASPWASLGQALGKPLHFQGKPPSMGVSEASKCMAKNTLALLGIRPSDPYIILTNHAVELGEGRVGGTRQCKPSKGLSRILTGQRLYIYIYPFKRRCIYT